MADKTEKNKNDYKIIISELGIDPFHVINTIFALVCVIPLLAVCYIVVGKRLLYDIFIGVDGAQMAIAILIAIAGLLYAYNLVTNMMEKLLAYAEERRRADLEKKEFMISVSHDLKIPLEVIRVEMGNIKTGVSSIVEGIIGESIKRCLEAANKLAGLIEDIVHFTSVDFVRMNLQRKLIDFRDIVTAGLDGAERLAKEKNLGLIRKLVTDNANLWGDERKLSRMTNNLITNAIKYTPQGGVVNVSVLTDADTVQLAIGNKGPGFLPEDMAMRYEKSGETGKYSGIEDMAVEISIIKDIVELHKGHITINSKPDKEMEFKIVLPRDLRVKGGIRDAGQKNSNGKSLATEGAMGVAQTLNAILKDLLNYRKTK